MSSLILRSLLFTILKPGIVVGLIPYFIISRYGGVDFTSVNPYHYMGGIVFAIGFTITANCILRFAVDGKGTLSPLDPTQKLVIRGWYKYSRNPMYIGVITMLLGEAIFFQSLLLLIYMIIVFLLFNLFIFFIEEPRLKKDFAGKYGDYCNKVRRWI